MSSPVSSCRRFFFGEDALECLVAGWVVGGAVLPAVPDDVEPGAGEDAHGMGVVRRAELATDRLCAPCDQRGRVKERAQIIHSGALATFRPVSPS